mgnify:CR=1 FL=1
MSTEGYSQLFDTEVTQQYQNSLKLNHTIDERHGLTGTFLNIPISDLLEMKSGTFEASDILATKVNETNIQVPTSNYYLKTVINGGEKTLYNFQKVREHASLHAKASARILDYIKINALYKDEQYVAGKIAKIPLKTGKNTGFNVDKLMAANALLEDEGIEIDPMQVSLWLPARLKPNFMADQRVDSIWNNHVKPLVDYKITEYLGVDFRILGQKGINTIPFVEDQENRTYQVPLVHRDAIVQGFNRTISTSVTWLPHQDRWELLTSITTGAKLIKPDGVVMIEAESIPKSNV